MNELVSIIIPVYNYGQFLGAAIDSVMKQSYRPIEVIIVDDGSTDNTSDIAHSYEDVQYVYQPNQGVAVARNTGISKARGKFIAFLDADDTWHPDKLEIQIRHLIEHPDIGINICKIQNFFEPGISLGPKIISALHENDQIGMPTIVTYRDIFDKIGCYDPRYKVSEDFDWFIRAKDAGIKMAILPDILLNRRIHNHNLSIHNPQACLANRLQIMKESIERQRKKKGGPNGEK
jgi:glycosyltransferase involved in cell wall biosynthesis